MVGKAIGIIPARGGSKRIPKKNIVDLLGKPMLAWTIEAALESGCFDYLMVSTDDDDIANVAIKYGASVPFMRDTCADDFSTVSDVIVSALKDERLPGKGEYTRVAQLMPNCPFRSAADIRGIMARHELGPSGFLLSGVEYGWMNPWWAHEIVEGEAKPLFPNAIKARSQDLPKILCPSGAIWVAQVDSFLTGGSFYGPGYNFFELSMLSAVDIDTYSDFEFAIALYQKEHEGQANEACI